MMLALRNANTHSERNANDEMYRVAKGLLYKVLLLQS